MDLATTNAFLGIMAAVSVLEAVVLIGLLAGGIVLYRRLLQTLTRMEAQHVVPTMARVNGILDDVKGVTGVVREVAEGVDSSARRGVAWLFGRFWRHRGAA